MGIVLNKVMYTEFDCVSTPTSVSVLSRVFLVSRNQNITTRKVTIFSNAAIKKGLCGEISPAKPPMFATQVIPATASEAPYILDGLLMNDAGRHIREQFTDTGGFTDHVFAACAILGYRFAPRIRDLPSKRLYAFNPSAAPAHLRALIGGKVNQAMIERNWPDILRIAATIAAGTVAPSQILRKLASYPRQNELATALREVGRVERTLFMIDWILDAELQRRAQIGLNKGEAHHALKRAISFHRRGEIRDRSAEGQHYRIAGMNLLAAIIIFWNTMKLGEVVANQKRDGKLLSPDLLAHVSPLGWEHINLTGEYRWPKP